MLKILHSIVSTESVLDIIRKNYPATVASGCELLELGCNDNYRIYGKRRGYVFRLYRLAWWPEKDIDEELRLLEFLVRRKLNVCKPVKAIDKKRFIKVKTPEGLRYGALFDFIEGKPMGMCLGKSNINMLKLGNLMGDMHVTVDDMKQPVERWTIGFENIVTHFLENAPLVLGHREKDLKYLNLLAGRLEDIIFSQPEGALNSGLCHGDLHMHNVMLQANGELAMFDFDWAGYSWRVYDMATVWWTLQTRQAKPAPWHAFVRGYQQIRKLSKQEKNCLPWFVVFPHFEYLNFQLSMRKHIGTTWLGDDYYDRNLQFFRSWEKQHLQ